MSLLSVNWPGGGGLPPLSPPPPDPYPYGLRCCHYYNWVYIKGLFISARLAWGCSHEWHPCVLDISYEKPSRVHKGNESVQLGEILTWVWWDLNEVRWKFPIYEHKFSKLARFNNRDDCSEWRVLIGWNALDCATSEQKKTAESEHPIRIQLILISILHQSLSSTHYEVLYGIPEHEFVRLAGITQLSGINNNLVSWGKKFISLPWDSARKYWSECILACAANEQTPVISVCEIAGSLVRFVHI